MNGADLYGLERNEGSLTLERRQWRVSDDHGGVVPFRAGAALPWAEND